MEKLIMKDLSNILLEKLIINKDSINKQQKTIVDTICDICGLNKNHKYIHFSEIDYTTYRDAIKFWVDKYNVKDINIYINKDSYTLLNKTRTDPENYIDDIIVSNGDIEDILNNILRNNIKIEKTITYSKDADIFIYKDILLYEEHTPLGYMVIIFMNKK